MTAPKELHWEKYEPHRVPRGMLGAEMWMALNRRLHPDVDPLQVVIDGEVIDEDEHKDWLEGVRDGAGPAADDAVQLLRALSQYGKIVFKVREP